MEVPFRHAHLLNSADLARTKPLYHPPIVPPPTKKADIFNVDKLEHVTEFVFKTPIEVHKGTLPQLVQHLCSDQSWSDLEKLWALLRWVTTKPAVFANGLNLSEVGYHAAISQLIRCDNYQLSRAILMDALCHLAGIPCFTVKGYTKALVCHDSAKPIDWGVEKLWNIVHVAGGWRLMDVQGCCEVVSGANSGEWVSIEKDGQRQNLYDGAFGGFHMDIFDHDEFLPDPERVKWVWFPTEDPKYQLLSDPVTKQDFEDHFFLRESFHDFGLTEIADTKVKGIVETVGGEIVLPFGIAQSRSPLTTFSYELLRKREGHERKKNFDSMADRFVFPEYGMNIVSHGLRFPVEGRYKIILKAVDKSDPTTSYFICEYVIDCPEAMPDCQPFPPVGPIGWGPGPASVIAGLAPLEHKKAVVSAKNGHLEIRLSKEKAIALHQMLKNCAIDAATLTQYTITEVLETEVVIYLRLPQKGEYGLSLYAQNEDEEGVAANVLNYLIDVQQQQTEGQGPFPRITTGVVGRNEIMSTAMGIQAVSHPQGKIESESGEVMATFDKTVYRTVVTELHSCSSQAQKTSEQVVQQDDKGCQVKLGMPVEGEYALNVFCLGNGDPPRLHNVHSYLITSDGTEKLKKVMTSAREDKEVQTQLLRTEHWEVSVDIPKPCENPAVELHRMNGNDPPAANTVQQHNKGKKKWLTVGLEAHGDYMMTLYDMDTSRDTVQAVSRYLIEYQPNPGQDDVNLNTLLDDVDVPSDESDEQSDDETGVEVEDEKTRQQRERELRRKKAEKLAKYRRALDRARELNSADRLQKLIAQFLENDGEDDDEALVYARHHLRILKAKEGLEKACKERDINAIDEAIVAAEKVNKFNELTVDIQKAVEMKSHLERVAKLRHKVLDMAPRTISEIKHYQKPPTGVHECMAATCLLLGYPGSDFKEWKKVQGLLSRLGQESVWTKIRSFDPSSTPEPRAKRSETIIVPFDKKQIHDVSSGAATFYVWCDGMIKEIYNVNKERRKEMKRQQREKAQATA